MPKQSGPVANNFAPVDLDRLQERLLDAVPGICVIAHQPVNGTSYDTHMLAYNRFPIRHLRALVKNGSST